MKKEHLKIKVSDLKANPKNPKQHDDKLIKDSIQDLGFVDDIVIDEKNVILAGHGRLKALEELGTKEIDVIRISGWTQEQKDRYLLLSNKSVEKGGWDFEMLAQIDKELLKQVGFESQELDKIFKDLNKDDDEVPEVQEKPTSKLGDIYQLGKHRLVCGDALKRDDVEKLMNGVKANMVFTDPPYRLTSKKFGSNQNRQYGELDSSKVFTFDKWVDLLPDIVSENVRILVWENQINTKDLWLALEKWFEVKGMIIWFATNRNNFFKNPRTGLFSKYDICLVAGRGKRKLNRTTGPPVDLILETTERKSRSGQISVFGAKPIEILVPYIQIYTNREEIILDLFGGSGSTLIACEHLDRKCYMMELDPKYCDVIIKRWENFTKLKAKKL